MSTLVSDYFNYVDTAIVGFVAYGASSLAKALIGPFTALLGFSFVMFGIGVARGVIHTPIETLLWKMCKVAFCVYLAFAAGAYSTQLAAPIYGIPGELVAVMTQGATKAPNMVIDDALDKGVELAVAFKNLATGWKPADALGLYLTALVVFLGTVIICAISAALILLTKFAIGVLLAAGVLFIALFAFPWGQKLAEGWVTQLLNYVLMFLFLGITVNLLFAMWVAGLEAAKGDVSNGWTALLPAIFNGVVAYLILRQIEFITRGVTGGWHMITPNVLGAANKNVFRPLGGAAKSAAATGAGWLGAAAAAAGGAVGGAAQRAWSGAAASQASRAARRAERGDPAARTRATREGSRRSSRDSSNVDSESAVVHLQKQERLGYDKGHKNDDKDNHHGNSIDFDNDT